MFYGLIEVLVELWAALGERTLRYKHPLWWKYTPTAIKHKGHTRWQRPFSQPLDHNLHQKLKSRGKESP